MKSRLPACAPALFLGIGASLAHAEPSSAQLTIDAAGKNEKPQCRSRAKGIEGPGAQGFHEGLSLWQKRRDRKS
jgi:hypothetical protein